MGDAAADAVIHAAGCVLWRPGDGDRGREVALVHRPRYDDWSLPKGKCQPGEHVLETAVREVAEETGIAVVLGRRLESTSYQRDGGLKVVDYWAARPAAAGPQPGFVPNDETDRLEWLPVPAARGRMSYTRDHSVLDDFASGPADTFPCILVRHAVAGTKTAWQAAGHADDLLRPLDAQGIRDADLLARMLACYATGRVVSSPAERCVATVRPYATRGGLVIEIEPSFAASAAGHAPADWLLPARRRIEELVEGQVPAVVCAHRENMPMLLDWACARLGAKVPEGPPLHKGSFWVLHIGAGALISAERHHPSVF
jgi:8-oxo-dGTP pyrophosphatase MutT (NUDIX family)/phosphohistidine phosphatase SixA